MFYGWWDWRFLSLIFLSSVVDYYIGIKIYNSTNKSDRYKLLFLSVFFNLGLLGFFKYYNFFISSWISLFSSLGYTLESIWTLKVILPVGISFYTFQTLSYTLDIYYKRLKPTKDFISFAAFISFFPQLVAGPIERASNLLPQITSVRKFNYKNGVISVRQITWGLFKKIVIADNCAQYANLIFDNFITYNSSALILGLFFFSFQIYCDFSGYSDIAIGTARLFGIKLMTNFNFPYFSRNIGEFWRRWHISLSSWFRDYLYIPMGGSKSGKLASLKNILIIFLVSGFWHGANWTFIFWGLFHSIMFIPLFLLGTNRIHSSDVVAINSFFPSIKEILQILFTFLAVMIAWVFFRSPSIVTAFSYLINIFDASILDIPNIGAKVDALKTLMLILFQVSIEWINRSHTYGYEKKIFNNQIDLLILIVMIILFRNLGENLEFIYFQF